MPPKAAETTILRHTVFHHHRTFSSDKKGEMYPNTIPADVLVFINGLPRLPAAGPAGVPPHLPDAMRRFVLRRLGEQDPNDMSKIYMPMDGVSGANNDESVCYVSDSLSVHLSV